MLNRAIHIGLSPNVTFRDFLISFTLFFQPWKWQSGEARLQVEEWFNKYFGVETAVSFNAGRSALLALLSTLNLPPGSEVLLQVFTCVAVPNSIKWAGFTPVYVDIDGTLNLDVVDAERKTTSKTRVLIVQHTFGIPANLAKITAFCKKHQLILIEDCAHALGSTYNGKPVGSFGDGAFFSFGRDKVVSSVFGGVAIVNQKSRIKYDELLKYQQDLPYPSHGWIMQQLLHPLITIPVLYLYHTFGIGMLLLFLSQKLKLLSLPVYKTEEVGKQPMNFPQKYPNALATLLLSQLNRLEAMNEKRREIAEYYYERLKNKNDILPRKKKGTVYLRFNVLTSRADELRFLAKKHGIILGNWYHHLIDPAGVDMYKLGYHDGSCLRAEKVSRESLNLPTYPALIARQIQQVVELFGYPNLRG